MGSNFRNKIIKRTISNRIISNMSGVSGRSILFAFILSIALSSLALAEGKLFLPAPPPIGSGIGADTGSDTGADIVSENGQKNGENILDELDPFAPNIQEQLNALDDQYENATGLPPYILGEVFNFFNCYRQTCMVWADIVKSEQKLYLYINGNPQYTWDISTGVPGRETPDFDRHPDGRIYDAYTSTKYPGGNYNGLGNMPYAVFIQNGFAIHGTGQSNWSKLGRKASHGCIRLHPDNGYIFNRLVRQYGIDKVWITVH